MSEYDVGNVNEVMFLKNRILMMLLKNIIFWRLWFVWFFGGFDMYVMDLFEYF